MNKWLPLLLLMAGCAGSTTVDSHAKVLSRTSRDQAIVSVGGGADIVTAKTFVWEDTDPAAVAFNLYYGTQGSRIYDTSVQGITSQQCVVSNLIPGTTYYLAATAVDSEGAESDFSDEYVFLMPVTLEMDFQFGQSVTNVSVQSSSDLMTWQASSAQLRSNGVWQVNVDPSSPVEFYRGIGQAAPAL